METISGHTTQPLKGSWPPRLPVDQSEPGGFSNELPTLRARGIISLSWGQRLHGLRFSQSANKKIKRSWKRMNKYYLRRIWWRWSSLQIYLMWRWFSGQFWMKMCSENRNNTLPWAGECVLWKYKQGIFRVINHRVSFLKIWTLCLKLCSTKSIFYRTKNRLH